MQLPSHDDDDNGFPATDFHLETAQEKEKRTKAELQLRKEQERFFETEHMTQVQFIMHCVVEGLPACLCYGDFYVTTLLARMMLQTHSNIDLVAGFGYLLAFIGIFYQTGL